MNSTQVVWASRLLLWMAGNMPRNASDKLQVSCSSTVLVTIYQTKYNHVLVLCNEVTSCCFATSLTKTLGSIISRINKLKTIFMCLFCYNLRSGVPIFFRGENKGTPDRRLVLLLIMNFVKVKSNKLSALSRCRISYTIHSCVCPLIDDKN